MDHNGRNYLVKLSHEQHARWEMLHEALELVADLDVCGLRSRQEHVHLLGLRKVLGHSFCTAGEGEENARKSAIGGTASIYWIFFAHMFGTDVPKAHE